MSGTLTRHKLYDLLWCKRRTTLAREMGLLDVWTGKQCRALNVPAPPPGYCDGLAAGGKPKAKYLRPPLTYTVAERIRRRSRCSPTHVARADLRLYLLPLRTGS